MIVGSSPFGGVAPGLVFQADIDYRIQPPLAGVPSVGFQAGTVDPTPQPWSGSICVGVPGGYW